MGTQQARTVTAHIDDKGTVEEVNDPFYDHFWDPDTRLDRALGEEHYGWTLKPKMETPIPVNPVFPGEIDICTNDPDDTAHLNTIATQKPKFVKLDVGYWGTYNREHPFQTKPEQGPPQRNFGMIQGRDVWLCNFSGIDGAAAGGNTNAPKDDSPAGKLLAYLKKKELYVEILTYAVAPSTGLTEDVDPDELIILFSDLHLPERFPDAPDEKKRQRLPDGDLRLPLRKELRNCQHEFGFLAGNSDMDEKKAAKIQDYLEGKADNANDQFFVKETHTFSADKTYTYFRDNVLAEKYILDRTIRTRSCWYYGPAKGNSEDGDHEAKPDFAQMNAGPSVDLATFLAAVLVVRDKQGANIKVIQLGDLYELWMGREFLYLDFPVTTSFDTFSIPNFALIALQRKFHFMGGEDDDFQYRFDEDWSDGKVRHAIKRYPFHQFPRSEMIKRHKTGWDYFKDGAVDKEALAADVSDEIVERVKTRLAERAANVEAFSLPLPSDTDDSTRVAKLKAVLKEASGKDPDVPSEDENGPYELGSFKQKDVDPDGIAPLPADEYRWHALIFKLFGDLGFRNIHGNHDGYRSDPVLSEGASFITAEEWISLPGIWIEHGHRWDEFNRDGCAIGAGMTNMVYYHNLSMLESDRGSSIKDCFMNQDEKCFLPGAAQWFLLVNMTDNEFKNRAGTQTVLPFGIVVVGHTHHPDLCYIDYEKQGAWDSFVEVAEKIGKDIVDGVEYVAGKVGDAAKAVGNAASSAANAVSGAADAAADKVKSLF